MIEPPANPVEVLIRLSIALALGALVALIYRKARGSEVTESFPPTLVFLSVLIAMVTQVVGGNAARAFALVGALSIVRFRTVVRDTQDTAYVIFAVVVGMAVGAGNLWVGGIGIVVISVAAFAMKRRGPAGAGSNGDAPFMLRIRVGLGMDLHARERHPRHLSERASFTIDGDGEAGNFGRCHVRHTAQVRRLGGGADQSPQSARRGAGCAARTD